MRRALVLFLGLLAGGLLTACGGSGVDPDSPAGVLAAVPDVAARAGTAEVETHVTWDLGRGPTTGRGVVRLPGQAHVSFPAGGGPTIDWDVEIVVDDDVMYVSDKRLAHRLDAPWARAVFEDIDGEAADELAEFVRPGQSDPAAALALLRGVTDDAREVRVESVEGVETTWYKATVDTAQAIERAGDLAARLEAYLRFTLVAGNTSLPIDAWIDEDGLVRRFGFEVVFEETAARPASNLFVGMNFSDYGTDVTIDVPDEADTADLTGT